MQPSILEVYMGGEDEEDDKDAKAKDDAKVLSHFGIHSVR